MAYEASVSPALPLVSVTIAEMCASRIRQIHGH